MYKGEISWRIFKVVFLKMRILRIRQYVMWPTIYDLIFGIKKHVGFESRPCFLHTRFVTAQL